MALFGSDDWLALGASIPDPSNYDVRPGWDYDYAIATDPLGGLGGHMYGSRNWADGSDAVAGWEDTGFQAQPIPKGQGSGLTGIPLGTIAPYQGWGQGGGAAPIMVNPGFTAASVMPGFAGRPVVQAGKVASMWKGVNWVELAIGTALAGAVGLFMLKRK